MHSGRNDSDSLEIEVKFWVKEINVMRERIIFSGAIPKGKTFETNLRFDDNAHTLIKKRSLLRLRLETNGINTLTFKSPPPVYDDGFKVFSEHEVTVSDADRMMAILNGLGYRAVQRYEKWRETFDLNNTLLCLDEMPFGTFLEIEGRKDDIQQASHILGLDWKTRITENYLALFDQIRQKMVLRFTDVTFENFSGIDFTPEHFWGITGMI
ncbi:MAG TPA: class IV adenylate cyclase [Desulfatirhabdiaceae bacterium]|nr:class IV adenylate cyclase [Desulfatirhabdiaceae bacterium]